ncbi:MAG: hypothetical protein FWE62_00310 [Firmicutes bacterium]|nr:hypothetical protein [Bacillota bacterium]
MTFNARAKINLILEAGPNCGGMHPLRMLTLPVELADRITVTTKPGVDFTGAYAEGIPAKNTVTEAIRLFEAAVFEKYGMHPASTPGFILERNIPPRAGLGASSAAAARVLKYLNDTYGAPLSPGELAAVALKIGSDLPYFLTDAPALVSGYGEIVEPIPFFRRLPLLLFIEPSGINTRECFAEYDRLGQIDTLTNRCETAARRLEHGNIAAALALVYNSLTSAACSLDSRIVANLAQLKEYSPYAGMTGSGSCVFAVFEDEETCGETLFAKRVSPHPFRKTFTSF